MSKRPNSTKMRRLCFEAHRYVHPLTSRTVMDCYKCGAIIEPASDTWECDHVIARALSDNDGISNLAPICAGKGGCHQIKTRADVKVIAKVKRISNLHFGVKRSSKPMPFGRNSPWKKKFNGEIVPR